ncbi:MAG: hypothetical protein NZM33_07505 [Bryobacteraceae bacterium]|nr:hypothetical protein [Bryobacteraceae bacterium]
MEQLGSMTPEELEAIPGIDRKAVEEIQFAVNAYYAQFEEALGVSSDIHGATTAVVEAGLLQAEEGAHSEPEAAQPTALEPVGPEESPAAGVAEPEVPSNSSEFGTIEER